MTDHAIDRLYSRVKPYHLSLARQMVARASGQSVAVVSSVGKHTVSNAYRVTGDDSNGDNLVVIVRNNAPVTVMYCRTGQINAEHLRVSEIRRAQ
jgi:hypothetical protein